MSLTELWNSTPEQLQEKHVQQIISFAGKGKLKDGNDASKEFRQFLFDIPSDLLSRYAEECLTNKFEGSGLALQDIINQVARRLGFTVADGRYRGGAGHIGFDGVWQAPEGYTLITEVKTTDAYSLNLDIIAEYRRTLIKSGEAPPDRSFILLVVGRDDTGGLEAQIRGSKHAWDVRLISVDALIRLMKLKESVENPKIHQQIREILLPREFTKVDGIIDLVFLAAEDIGQEEQLVEEHDEDVSERRLKLAPVNFHEACVTRIQTNLLQKFVRRSRATFVSPDGSLLLICAVSRQHEGPTSPNYWFAFHPHQKEALESATESYVAFGCGSEKTILLIPFREFSQWLEGMWTTEREDRFYWHVAIHNESERFILRRRKGYNNIDLTKYLLADKSLK